MNIGTASEMTNLPAKTIRYYEDIQLIRPSRARNGYREYSEQDVHRLRFLHRARSLGFSIKECRLLLSLYEDENRASANVKAVVTDKIHEIDRKISELKSLKVTLQALADACRGDKRPKCAIIDELSRKRDKKREGNSLDYYGSGGQKSRLTLFPLTR